ncbi:hypothetical protein SO802_033703 [Lithocarpus litseifolius]|uniref:C2 domain-containing protein n=1 Tax=Lithocarpus litseifolius TaxID=425828 RepID=A0AAW2BFG8_9ROSI
MQPYIVVVICDNNNKLIFPTKKSPRLRCSNPTWNFHVDFYINVAMAQEKHLNLVVKLKSYRNSHCALNIEIGVVRVPITKMLTDFGEADKKKKIQVSENLVFSDGTSQGKLSFSHGFAAIVEEPPADHPSRVTDNKLVPLLKGFVPLIESIVLGEVVTQGLDVDESGEA